MSPTMNFRTGILSLLLVSAAFVVTMTPSASAHDCVAEDPAKSCGECTSGDHNHVDRSNNVYCRSGSNDPEPDPECLVKVGSICIRQEAERVVDTVGAIKIQDGGRDLQA